MDVPLPTVGPGQVLVEVEYAGVNFKDVMLRRGDGEDTAGWPLVPGMEVAGVIAGLGEGANGLAIGDRVVALTNVGGLAEFALADARLTIPVPDSIPLEAVSVVPGALTTAELLVGDVARVRAGDVVVVYSAAGAVGEAIASIVRRLGQVTLIGVVGSHARRAAALSVGYDAAFVRDETLAETIRTWLGGQGVDVVLDPQGTHWLGSDLAMLNGTGRIVLFGNTTGSDLEPAPPTSDLFARNASVGGFSLSALSGSDPHLVGAAMSRALALLVDGSIEPRVTVVQGLESAPDIQQRLADGTGTGKYIININGQNRTAAADRLTMHFASAS